MSAPFPRHSLAGVPPANVGTVAARDRRPSGGLAFLAGRIAAPFRALGGGRSAVFNELNALSDRELADVGLGRGDIPRVFDPSFAAEHRNRR